MYSADELYDKLEEVKALIRENTRPDGSLNFDPFRVMVSLELARRMVLREEPGEENLK